MTHFASWVNPGEDPNLFNAVRSANRLLGAEERAEPIVRTYLERYADLASELQPHSLAYTPTAVGLVSPAENWSRLTGWSEASAKAGTTDGTAGWLATGRENDAERILAMDPDIIFLWVGSSSALLRDPRQGLKAVKTKRVHGMADFRRGLYLDIDLAPFATRWIAELARPERLRPRLRTLMRDYLLNAYGYRLSDAELDDMLSIAANPDSALRHSPAPFACDNPCPTCLGCVWGERTAGERAGKDNERIFGVHAELVILAARRYVSPPPVLAAASTCMLSTWGAIPSSWTECGAARAKVAELGPVHRRCASCCTYFAQSLI